MRVRDLVPEPGGFSADITNRRHSAGRLPDRPAHPAPGRSGAYSCGWRPRSGDAAGGSICEARIPTSDRDAGARTAASPQGKVRATSEDGGGPAGRLWASEPEELAAARSDSCTSEP
jgi:hypothetical protein